ncbi:MAG: hypothetical protein LBR43_03660 [Spiroplasmataceae bacterium]|nr:hypothetical protein [Spiroplasmataceae bacterium]
MTRYTRQKRNTTNNNSRSSNYTFFNAETMKNNFFAHTSARQAQNISGDGGYWKGERCQWGGSHNLDEDCKELAKFFESVSNISEDIEKIRLSANEDIFKKNQQALVSKIKSLLGKCQVTSSTSLANVCCIWNDFFGSYLKSFIDDFVNRLTRQSKEIEKLEPKHQKELLDLESQARAAESAYKENLQKANDPNFSKEEQAQFIVLANRSAQEAERIKQKIARNPLMEVSKYNYLDDLKKLANGNVPKPDKKPKSNIGNSNGYSINNNSNSNETNKDFFSKYHKEIILILISIGLATYIIYYQDE